jgi:purine-binding chemotaxis protein CheW
LLISILSPERLFGHRAVSHAIEQNMGVQAVEATSKQADLFEQFLIFQLGDESYGMPIAAVDEVIRVPSQVTRMPGAPSFVMGVVNLRGKAVPLIDQRARFAAALSTQTAKARAIIVTIGGLQAGVVVDSVSEVKAVPVDALSAAPEFSTDRTDVFDRIAPIDSDGRMILLIDPKELLTRAEQDLMTTIAENNMVADKP